MQLKSAGNWNQRRKNLPFHRRNSRGEVKFHARNRRRKASFLQLAGKICRWRISPPLIPGTFGIRYAAEGDAMNPRFTRARRHRCGIRKTTWTWKPRTTPRDRVFQMWDYGIEMRTIFSNRSCGTSWIIDWCCIDWKYAIRRLGYKIVRFSDSTGNDYVADRGEAAKSENR